MPGARDHLRAVGNVVRALRRIGLEPVLVGGMALVILGSRRVTRDFDFVVARLQERLDRAVDALYDHGLELASRLNDAGDVAATIQSRRVAVIRLRLDKPSSAYFFHPTTGLRVDLLFDFPLPAAELLERATRIKIRGQLFRVASEPDLLRLKRLARAERTVAGDAEDIAFLEARKRN